jgi:hypothetical protein
MGSMNKETERDGSTQLAVSSNLLNALREKQNSLSQLERNEAASWFASEEGATYASEGDEL